MKKKVDVLIKDGLIYDGSISEPYLSDIEISSDRISAIGMSQTRDADCIIDAREMVVSPGFIDTHAHSDFTIVADPRAEGKIYQGITTEINGNCGLSAAPLYGAVIEKRAEDFKELGISEKWNTLRQYFEIIHQRGISINIASLVGHGNVRGSVMGYKARTPAEHELDKMSELIETSLNDGAIGLSTGLIYPPGVYTSTDELVRLTKNISKESCIYTSHMRSEGDELMESIEEIIAVGQTGTKVHISHLKTAGKKNWPKADKVISRLFRAREEGVKITCDRYPYTASSTELDSLLPSWVFEGGDKEEMRRLSDEKMKEKIRKELTVKIEEDGFWEDVRISSVVGEQNRWMEGKTISDISRALDMSLMDTFFKILLEEKLRAGAIFSQMSEENLQKFLSLPFCMIGSDSSARCFDGPTKQGKPHPRGFGAFPRFFGRYVYDEQIMDLTYAIHKATMLPAQTFGIKGRGQIREGMYADLVIFDPVKMIDKATYENPFQKPEGVHYVLVNGVTAFREGEYTGKLAGRVLTHG
jgi:N-acyl-D-amino-acid deacylase